MFKSVKSNIKLILNMTNVILAQENHSQTYTESKLEFARCFLSLICLTAERYLHTQKNKDTHDLAKTNLRTVGLIFFFFEE